MLLTVTPHREQPEGVFDAGAILERKPMASRRTAHAARRLDRLLLGARLVAARRAHRPSPAPGVRDPHLRAERLDSALRHGERAVAADRGGRGAGHPGRPRRLARRTAGAGHGDLPDLGGPRPQAHDPAGAVLHRLPARAVRRHARPGAHGEDLRRPRRRIELDTPGIAIREYWLEPGAHELGPGADRAFAALPARRRGGLGDARSPPATSAWCARPRACPSTSSRPAASSSSPARRRRLSDVREPARVIGRRPTRRHAPDNRRRADRA